MLVGKTSLLVSISLFVFLLLIFPSPTFLFMGLILRDHLIYFTVLLLTSIMSSVFFFHALLMPIKWECTLKWDKDIQRYWTAIWPYASLIASEVISCLCFYLNCCHLENRGFSFLFCGLLRAIQKCHLTKKKKRGGGQKKKAHWTSDYDTFWKLQGNYDTLPQTVRCIFQNPSLLCNILP